MKKSDVYYLPWNERARLGELLTAASFGTHLKRGDLTAIKIHFGERGATGYISPKFLPPVIKAIRAAKGQPFVTETNTIYRGARTDAVSHLTVAAEHGFSQTKIGVPVTIADGLRGLAYEEIPIEGGRHFKTVKIASDIVHADAIVALSHVKGHLACGFGGTLKNLGMGCGARVGKYEMHAGSVPALNPKFCTKCGACMAICPEDAISFVEGVVTIDAEQCAGCGQCVASCDYNCLNVDWTVGRTPSVVQERVAEYAAGAIKGKRLFCINFVNHITPNCDCMGKDEEPVCADVGILASADPVALDQASLDLLNKHAGFDVFQKLWPHIDHTIQLAHAEAMGLGSRTYEIVEV